ncbi:Membrane protease subunit, stomatin/prohibitin family, contains C-terminal Zn-ribbon domain [Myroides marinus]|uniref:Membrane protease subunit, stomatin/prohibitin family, contains C-terminal Zn-ribbon domain n=1 Tax=Myroides marinus TaxID=703342 RepID=A0A1H6XBH4_9FLAO|nr:SPFH domain-containing protein [Myroides marinus]MDM1369485.1 SPFH domain-containing protein [Myroides marinus]MDM1371480.1 SPFH domain-containing protein [Myroides marinus]MDM1376580.1 SPFH domain-containing protein [Myroides marinus]MDM1383798.1 SPFH domain-containing protein [Myroides marinus]SEJ26521.1 Membrane protease subunit, stomatin/prohibitin family, contains C-terminal Zn-ribbon domain [Myroides marinus]
MNLFRKLAGEFIDIIEFLDPTQNTIVHRFERYQNEIKNNAKLVVREGQMAVFINEGQLADVFSPGTHTLNTQNLPILATLKGWKYGFNSPFKAEVYFVSTKTFIDQRWGTKNPIILNDDRFGMIEVRSFGTYTFKIADPGKFIKEIVGTSGTFTTDQINDQLRSAIVTRFTDSIGEANLPIETYAANLNELSNAIFAYMKDDFEVYGMDVTKFLIENVSMPEDIKKEIFELSRLERVDLNKLMQMKAAKAMEAAANNPSGVAGAGVGMGAGFAMANQFGQAMAQGQTSTQQQAQQPVTNTPPPIPGAVVVSYFVALNGQQAGPFDLEGLKQMVSNGQLLRDTLVWKNGMANWDKAGNQGDLNDVWGQTPPPLPNI